MKRLPGRYINLLVPSLLLLMPLSAIAIEKVSVTSKIPITMTVKKQQSLIVQGTTVQNAKSASVLSARNKAVKGFMTRLSCQAPTRKGAKGRCDVKLTITGSVPLGKYTLNLLDGKRQVLAAGQFDVKVDPAVARKQQVVKQKAAQVAKQKADAAKAAAVKKQQAAVEKKAALIAKQKTDQAARRKAAQAVKQKADAAKATAVKKQRAEEKEERAEKKNKDKPSPDKAVTLSMPFEIDKKALDKKALIGAGKDALKQMSKMKPAKKGEAMEDPIGRMTAPFLGGAIGLGNMGSGDMEVDIRGDRMNPISSIIGEDSGSMSEIGEITKGYDGPTPGEMTGAGAGDVGRDAEEATVKLEGLLNKADQKGGSKPSKPSKLSKPKKVQKAQKAQKAYKGGGIVAMTESLADIDDEPSGNGPTDQPVDQFETVEIKWLDDFQQEERERQAKANAGAKINYGDQVQGATNTLDEAAAKAEIDGMTRQYGPDYVPRPSDLLIKAFEDGAGNILDPHINPVDH